MTAPPGLVIHHANPVTGWTGVADGTSATWTGGSLPPKQTERFAILLKADVDPGLVQLDAKQLYDDGNVVSWPVADHRLAGRREPVAEPRARWRRRAHRACSWWSRSRCSPGVAALPSHARCQSRSDDRHNARLAHAPVEPGAGHRTRHGCDEVDPELRPLRRQERRPERPRGVHRRAGDATTEQRIEGDRPTDRDRGRCADRSSISGHGHDHEHQQRRS